MRVTSKNVMPWVGLTQNENGEIHLDNGMFAEVFKELSVFLNFSYTVTTPPDGEWGRMKDKDNGIWTGMVGQLQSKTVDFGSLFFILEIFNFH